MVNGPQLHRVDYEHPLISEFDPNDFEKRPRPTWSDAEEFRRICVRLQCNVDKPFVERVLNVIVGNVVSPSLLMDLHTVLS